MTTRPKAKFFDNSKHLSMIDGLEKNMAEKKFEKLSEIVVPDILTKYEGFSEIIKGPNFIGTPFDFFGFKDNCPYIIEFKGSLSNFNTPGETQKRRLKEILAQFKDLHIALIQVKLRKSQYRIFYDEDIEILFGGKQAPLEPIVNWIKGKIL